MPIVKNIVEHLVNIWSSREKSLVWLNNELHQESKVLQEGFDYFEQFVEVFQRTENNEGESQIGRFCQICLITLAKFNHLLLGSYSLMLDGLAQEGGALLRPLIETYELLIYFRLDITRIDEVFTDKLPSAGIIGKEISGEYQRLRNYLNDNASHFSYKEDSVRHLYNQNGKIMLTPTQDSNNLRANLSLINAFQVFILMEAVNCLFVTGFDANSLGNEMDGWRDKSVNVFRSEK